MRYLTFILAAMMGLALVDTARAQSDLLVPAQAADVLSDLITVTNSRADARVEAMHRYLREIGKEEAFDQAKLPAATEKSLPFSEVFKGAMLFVKNGGGAKYADPALASMSNPQLTNELTELQVYNIQQFEQLMKKKKAVDAMRAYLKSSGNLEGYLKWAKVNAPGMTQPAPTTPEQVAARMGEMIKSAKETAWKKAEARGMSQADFDKAWSERVEKYREAVAQKVDGCKELAASLSAPPPPAPKPVDPTTPIITGQGQRITAAPPPTPVQSQYSQSYTAGMYQQQNNELWNRFDDND
jgi:hypothetical protein